MKKLLFSVVLTFVFFNLSSAQTPFFDGFQDGFSQTQEFIQLSLEGCTVEFGGSIGGGDYGGPGFDDDGQFDSAIIPIGSPPSGGDGGTLTAYESACVDSLRDYLRQMEAIILQRINSGAAPGMMYWQGYLAGFQAASNSFI